MNVELEIKKAITTSVELVGNLDKFISQCDRISKASKEKILDNLYSHAYFAGGMYRSLFTRQPINDYDIFFDKLEAGQEVVFLLGNTRMSEFTRSLTGNGNLNVNGAKYSFNIVMAAAPKVMVERLFDFSFNRHYFLFKDGSHDFDLKTFRKEGHYCYTGNEIDLRLLGLKRYFYFLGKGFKIEPKSMLPVFYIAESERLPYGAYQRLLGDGAVSRLISNGKYKLPPFRYSDYPMYQAVKNSAARTVTGTSLTEWAFSGTDLIYNNWATIFDTTT